MTVYGTRRAFAVVLAPVLLTGLLTILDGDFLFTMPIAAGSAMLVALISFRVSADGNWGLHGLIAGIAGFAAMLALLMNLPI